MLIEGLDGLGNPFLDVEISEHTAPEAIVPESDEVLPEVDNDVD